MSFLRKEIFKHLLLIIFIGYYGSTTYFNHTHIENGDVITHSHPYAPYKSDKAPHHHSKSDFIHISLLSHFITTTIFFIFLGIILKPQFKTSVKFFEEKSYSFNLLQSNTLRGPPIH